MMSGNNKFRSLRLRGNPAEIGHRHGMILADEIRHCLDFYRAIFALSEEELLEQGQYFGVIIEEFNASYASEIKAVAEGAALDARLLFALNSRSEIFNNGSLDNTVAECTTVFNKRDRFLAQNWDWSEKIAPLVVDMRIEHSDAGESIVGKRVFVLPNRTLEHRHVILVPVMLDGLCTVLLVCAFQDHVGNRSHETQHVHERAEELFFGDGCNDHGYAGF